MKFFTLITVLFFSGSVSASCAAPRDHVEQRACSTLRLDALAHQVLAAQHTLRDKITTWDEEPEYKAAALANFDNAARAFQRYQAQQCAFDASLAAGGNNASDLRIECNIELYSSYLKYIQAHVAAFK